MEKNSSHQAVKGSMKTFKQTAWTLRCHVRKGCPNRHQKTHPKRIVTFNLFKHLPLVSIASNDLPAAQHMLRIPLYGGDVGHKEGSSHFGSYHRQSPTENELGQVPCTNHASPIVASDYLLLSTSRLHASLPRSAEKCLYCPSVWPDLASPTATTAL